MEKLTWSALEYEEKERGTDWFLALGIIIVTSSIAAIIYENYFFAVLLFLSGLLLGFFAVKKPEVITYELNNKGLKIRTRVYPYKNIKSFWVQADLSGEHNLEPVLFIKSERAFMPILSIPIEEGMAGDIRAVLLEENIIEEEMKEHPSMKIMESLGF